MPDVDGYVIGVGNDEFTPVYGGVPGYNGAVIGTIVGDIVPPVVTIVSPPSGAKIGVNTSVVVDITDDSGAFRRILPVVTLDIQKSPELVHDGDSFTASYAGSTRVAIANGYRYTFIRKGGWPSSPTFKAYVIDESGNEAP